MSSQIAVAPPSLLSIRPPGAHRVTRQWRVQNEGTQTPANMAMSAFKLQVQGYFLFISHCISAPTVIPPSNHSSNQIAVYTAPTFACVRHPSSSSRTVLIHSLYVSKSSQYNLIHNSLTLILFLCTFLFLTVCIREPFSSSSHFFSLSTVLFVPPGLSDLQHR